MTETVNPAPIAIRSAVAADADGITRVYMESAEHHASLDSERYWIPDAEAISARYSEGRQHPENGDAAITLVAELGGDIVGFVDVRLDRSPDPMHRDILYCHVIEIAVSRERQSQRIGERLLQAAEEWGRQQGAEFAMLEYNAANTRAGSFYQQRMSYRSAGHIMVKRL